MVLAELVDHRITGGHGGFAIPEADPDEIRIGFLDLLQIGLHLLRGFRGSHFCQVEDGGLPVHHPYFDPIRHAPAVLDQGLADLAVGIAVLSPAAIGEHDQGRAQYKEGQQVVHSFPIRE